MPTCRDLATVFLSRVWRKVHIPMIQNYRTLARNLKARKMLENGTPVMASARQNHSPACATKRNLITSAMLRPRSRKTQNLYGFTWRLFSACLITFPLSFTVPPRVSTWLVVRHLPCGLHLISKKLLIQNAINRGRLLIIFSVLCFQNQWSIRH